MKVVLSFLIPVDRVGHGKQFAMSGSEGACKKQGQIEPDSVEIPQ